MFNRKNVGNKERIARVTGGCLMILYGLIGLHTTWLGITIAGVGFVNLVTGALRYCPVRAVSGRKSTGH
ncbi:YgaP family membrane protein [Serratia sp. D1N4]